MVVTRRPIREGCEGSGKGGGCGDGGGGGGRGVDGRGIRGSRDK